MHNSLNNLNYILYSEKSKQAIYFDPYDINLMPKELHSKINIRYLVNTHHHPDHIRDNERLLERTQCEKITLRDGEKLEIAPGEEIIAMATPGHTSDHFCFLICENGKEVGLICGDTIFHSGVGNTKNGGDVEELFLTTQMLKKRIADDVTLYPSHDFILKNLLFAQSLEPGNEYITERINIYQTTGYYLTTMGMEKSYNPFFRTDQLSIQRRLNTTSEHDTFVAIRRLRDNW